MYLCNILINIINILKFLSIMATSKGFFGIRRGSTKSHTFSEVNGKQVTKDRVYNVKNPKSLLQMQQRLCVAQAGQAYKAFKEIVDHSFEGKSSRSLNHNYFMKKNIDICKSIYKREDGTPGDTYIPAPKNFNYFSAYPALISEGSLSLNADFNGTASAFLNEDFALLMGLSFKSSDNYEFSESTTVEDFCKIMGVDMGDQLTFIFVIDNSVNDTVVQVYREDPKKVKQQDLIVKNIPSNKVFISRIVIGYNKELKIFKKHKPTSSLLIFDPMALNQSNSFNYDILGIDTSFIGIINSGQKNTSGMVGACLIRSKYDNIWRRSTSHMVINNSYGNDSQLFDTYPVGGWGVESDTAYLNNAVK